MDETPKGWFISLIQADPLEEIGKHRKAKRDRAERDEEQRRCCSLKASCLRAGHDHLPFQILQHALLLL